jgi:uncharacterized protein
MNQDWTRPVPRVTSESTAYWKACSETVLTLGRCGACDKIHHHPQAVCPFCWSSDVTTMAASGRGTVNSFSIIHQSAGAAFSGQVPYIVAYIELEEGVYLVSTVVNCPTDQLKIGMPVEVQFEIVGSDIGVPVFVPV